MRTYDVTFSREVPFGLFMYADDNAPTLVDVRAALKRRGLSDKAISRVSWRISVVERPDFGGGRIGANRER
jgi:hypothetical protein